MHLKIGIPRGLWFYDYYPLWKSFYEELGAEVILSSPTNKSILDKGVKNTVDEACLPVKIFHGHVLDLKDRVDYLFVPKMMSVYEKEYICPKFCGLPEMVSHSIKDLPPIIDTEINFNRSRKHLMNTVYRFGSYVTKNPIAIHRAYKRAVEEYSSYKARMKEGNLPINGEFCERYKNKSGISIAVMGHSYNIYDKYGSMSLIDKLEEMGIKIITPEMMDYATINQHTDTLEKKMFWSYGRKLLGTAMHLTDTKTIDGIVYLSSFGCGIDSIIEELVERKARKDGRMPFLLITVDEHTGEAGVNTRLEAFIDMIEWRKRNESNLSTHG
ncbi:Predicted nucleotide-binding protein, sugar kinase/HSP70/actin superfamily [Natronincola peptidivorans]|uniref:Predicted nucleotide-binding protein, sugar kinase/HSP70/actin superfamily n=1 Tax=Natronincola peptidivorans TaxID=426128 RepID=A0A1I0D9C7_9FIRM|nr:acyl-CoA dehydratase activase-related protein [Natronincola peptidivorans]SET28879.1 Predicted nucleotide-binding protein, sugar kinase/HSP70/actin superfamily [Natronincola peptidivorans]